jgi:hypothetical protein
VRAQNSVSFPRMLTWHQRKQTRTP